MALFRKPSDPHAIPSVFPTYLLPSVPFRRKSRQSSTDSTNSTLSTSSTLTTTSSTSSNPFTRSPTPVPASRASSIVIPPDGKFLHGHSSRLHCAKCSTDLCLTSQIISKGFTGRHGRAYLVQGTPSHIHQHTGALPNTYQNKAVPRNLVTGQHTVSDISCAICGTVLGWKYVEASEEAQKYKVGKYILETKRIRIGVSWESDENSHNHTKYEHVVPLSPHELRSLNDGPSKHDHQHHNEKGVGGQSLDDVEFDSQDEDECEDLFAGVWSPALAARRRARKKGRMNRKEAIARSRNSSTDTLS